MSPIQFSDHYKEPELRRSARAGDAAAIALLVKGWLDRHPHLSCHAGIADTTLQLLLVSPVELPRRGVLSVLRFMLEGLGLPGVRRAEVKAVTTGPARSRWQSGFELNSAPELSAADFPRRCGNRVPALAALAAFLVLTTLALKPGSGVYRPPDTLPSSSSVAAVQGQSDPLYRHLEQLADKLPPRQPRQAQLPESPAQGSQFPSLSRASEKSKAPGQGWSPGLADLGWSTAPRRKVNSPLRLRIKAVGDLVPGTNYPRRRLLSWHDEQALLAELRGLLGGADLVFGNLETVLTDHPRSRKLAHLPNVYSFRTPPRYAQWLKAAGFDLLSIANNHALDFGPEGFADTIRHLHQAGIHGIGEPGRIRYVQRSGVRIALLGFSHNRSLNPLHDLEQARSLVRTAREQADLILVSVHAGAEGAGALRVTGRQEYYLGEPRGNPQQFARALVDEGADLILGHGPHVPRALELYRGRLVAYSLGNFIGYGGLSSSGPNGSSLVLEAELDGEGAFVAGRILPVRLNGRGLPRPDPGARSLKLIRKLSRRDIPGSELVIDADGWMVVSGSYAGLALPGNEG